MTKDEMMEWLDKLSDALKRDGEKKPGRMGGHSEGFFPNLSQEGMHFEAQG